MAVGAAPVSSPVGVNKEIVKHGVSGYLASNVEEWKMYLSRLIDDESERKCMGDAARDRIESSYSVKSALPLLIEAIGLSKP